MALAAVVALGVARAGLRALTEGVQRFDEGLLLSGPTFLAKGAVPFADYYQPYGPGTAIVGLFARAAGDALVVHRAVHALPGIALASLAFVVVSRRSGIVCGVAAAMAVLAAAPTTRYAVPILCLIVLDAGLRSSGEERLGRLGVVAGAAAWFRPEYVVFASLIIALSATRRRSHRLWLGFVIAATLPYAVIVLAGGGSGLLDFVRYSAFDFREFRGLPFNWTAVLSAWGRAFTGPGDADAMALTLSYAAGFVLAARTAWHASQGRIDSLAAVAVLVLAAQSVRFGSGHASDAVPLVSVALLGSGARARVALVAAAVLFVSSLGMHPLVPASRAREALQAQSRLPSTRRLDLAPLLEHERLTLVALDSLAAKQSFRGPVLVVNRQNDLTFANDAIAYWVADASPAAWATTFDPGLTDRHRIQKRVVASLCDRQGTVLQLPSRYANDEFLPSEFGSRMLDQYLALNYRHEGDAGFYRVLRHQAETCRLPWSDTPAAIGTTRDVLLATGEHAAAGSLSVLLGERGMANDRDTAIAVLGGYWISAAELRSHPYRELLLAFQEGQTPDLKSARGDPVLATIALEAWLRNRPPTVSTAEGKVATDLAFEVVRAWPQSARALQILFSIVPLDEAWLDRLATPTGPALREVLLLRNRIASMKGDQRQRMEALALVEPHLANDPVVAYETVMGAAERERSLGNERCSTRLRERAGLLLIAIPVGPFSC